MLDNIAAQKYRQESKLKQDLANTCVRCITLFFPPWNGIAALADQNALHQCSTRMVWPAGSSSTVRACCSLVYSCAPTPMAAGNPNSAARIAIWELAPPNMVI